MESYEKNTLTTIGQRIKLDVEETTLIIEGCIKESNEEHKLEGISYLSK